MRERHSLALSTLAPFMILAFAGCDTASPPTSTGPVIGDRAQASAESGANLPATTTASPALEATRPPDGIARIKGNFYTIRDGNATLLHQKQRFSEGVYFDRDGRITMQDGSIVRLREHEMVTFSGERLEVPPNIKLPKALPVEEQLRGRS